MNKKYDAVIIGGGAAGLAAAVELNRLAPDCKAALLEKNDRVGKKLLITGNGRCNLTNSGGFDGRYHGARDFAKAAINKFGLSETLEFFHSLGIMTVELENGKVFPLSLQANSVVDQLRYAVEESSCELIPDAEVNALNYNGSDFVVDSAFGRIEADYVLVCCGGKAAANTGSDGSGYGLLENFGHRCVRTFPSIVQVIVAGGKTKPLAGIKVEGTVTASSGGKTRTESGEILFTDYGLSGPPVLQISRMISEKNGGNIALDLLPDMSFNDIVVELEYRCAAFGSREAGNLLVGMINKRLGQTVIKTAGVSLSVPCGKLKDQDISSITASIKKFSFKATGTKAWNMAQVTAGGIDTIDFDADTMQSRLFDRLYAAGEILDVDGDCGGFNLQWAWTSGILAARSIANELNLRKNNA